MVCFTPSHPHTLSHSCIGHPRRNPSSPSPTQSPTVSESQSPLVTLRTTPALPDTPVLPYVNARTVGINERSDVAIPTALKHRDWSRPAFFQSQFFQRESILPMPPAILLL